MARVSKEYEIKTKMVHEELQQLKMKFWGGGRGLKFGCGVYWRESFQVGRDNQIFSWWGGLSPSPLSRENPDGCFGLFTKIRKGSDTSFWYNFLHDFFHKNVPYLILYLWTKLQCHTFFPSQKIKQNVLLTSYLDNWWYHEL